MADIDTVVNGDARSCRQAADWLARTASGVDANSAATAKAQAASESCWQGTAADGFREHVGRLGADADRLSASALTARQALDEFAADLDTVNAMVGQARSISLAAGLTVTPSAIEPPGAGPQRVYGPIPPTAATAFYQAQADHNAKVRAFNEAQATVSEARDVESRAHARLTGPMRDTTNNVRTLVSISSNVTGVGLSAIQEVHGTAEELYQAADRISQHGQRMEQLALDSELTDAGRAAAARAGQLADAGATETSAEADKIAKSVRRVPKGLRDAIAQNPSSVLEDSSGLLKVGKGVLKGLPYVGTGAALLFGGVEVIDGSRTPLQATTETGLSLAGGAVGGLDGAVLGSTIGSVVPIVGTTVGGVVGAITGSIVGSLAGGQADDELTGVH